MSHAVIISYADIGKPGGLPGVLKRLAKDLTKNGNGNISYWLYDLKSYFTTTTSGDLIEVDSNSVPRNRIYITIPWASPHKLLFHMVARRIKSEKNVIWPWGMFCKQQHQSHWNEGRKPLLLKKLYILTLKQLCLLLSDGFLMHSREEAEFSGISLSKCALVTMGLPPSKILDQLQGDIDNANPEKFSNDYFSYIGRGQYREKGIFKITAYAASVAGRLKKFHFLCSTCDADTRKHIDTTANLNEIWDFETSGTSLVPHLRHSQAYITVSNNPIQLRTPYEALSLGTPVITQAESMMEGMDRMFTRAGFPQAVHIVDSASFQSGNFTPPELNPDERTLLAKTACILLSPRLFALWLDGWLQSPHFPADFYADASCDVKQASNLKNDV